MFEEQLKTLLANLTEKQDKLKSIAQVSVDESRTMDSAEQAEFDVVAAEIQQIQDNAKRIKTIIEQDKATAKAVEPTPVATPSAAAAGLDIALPKNESVDKGLGFARYARVKALSEMERMPELQIAERLYPRHGALHKIFAAKAAVPAANTGSPDWIGAAHLDAGAIFADFVEFLRPQTLVGQVAPYVRSLPFNTPVLMQSTGGSAAWVKEGEAKPVTNWSYARAKLMPLKVAAIAAATKESLKTNSIAVDRLIRDELANTIIEAIDTTFASDDAAVADESPAGLLNGAPDLTAQMGQAPAGGLEGVQCDISIFLKTLAASQKRLKGAFWIMAQDVAIDLSSAITLAGATAYPRMTPAGGELAGLPVLVSDYVASGVVALVHGQEVYLADENTIDVSISHEASLLMDTAPAMDSTTPTPAQLVSLWQTNSVGFLVERYLNWQLRRQNAVVWATVDWSCN